MLTHLKIFRNLFPFIFLFLQSINKMNYIVVILALSFIAYKSYQKTRVPEGLKNIPTLSFLDLLIEIFTKVGPDKRWENTRDVLEKDGIGKVIIP